MESRNSLSFPLTALLFLVQSGISHGEVVINEIHYDPPENTEPAEFIELHNTAATAVSLQGWRLTGGVEFAFPAEASIPSQGYLVVAQDPAFHATRFGNQAVGPWSGRLKNADDEIQLVDGAGHRVDRVDYHLGFPWPTVGQPPGFSIELIHPSLDNDLGGNWRPSIAGGNAQVSRTTVIAARSTWSFFRGTVAPSQPVQAWRSAAFDGSGWESGALPIGYDPSVQFGTVLEDMRGQYSTVFLRRQFSVANADSVSALELEALYDDGFRVWLNGTQIFNVNLAAGELPFDGLAGPARESDTFDTFEIQLTPGVLREGANTLAVQVVNSSLNGSTDCYFDARLVAVRGSTGRGPSPGRKNIAYATNAPPAVRQVEHSPLEPRGGEAVVITARITDPEGVTSATLSYQVVDPGAYIELTDPSYETDWNDVLMKDDGSDADQVAGDGVFSARLPESLQKHRRLVRYRISATDGAAASVRVPYPDDPQPNFAYFVYDGVPAWSGAIRPGATDQLGQVFTVSAEEMNRLPVIHFLARRSTVEESTWLARYGGDGYPWLGTLVYGGTVYDHIHHRARGGVWRYAMCKNMWKFDFNRGHDFQAVDDWGRPFANRWTKLNLGACIQQGDFNHRGEQGMFESVGFRVFRLAGVPAVQSAFVQLRILDEAAELNPADQYSGDFWGLYLALEQPDGRFLDENQLPDGNFYKMEGGGGELNHLGSRGPADGSDLSAFLSDYNNADEDWWRRNFNVANYLSYQTVVQAIHHYDICYDKNFFYYHNPEKQQWQVTPWDLDLTWAENMFDAGCGGVDRIKERLLSYPDRFPGVWREWQNRIREFRDLFWNADEAGRLIDEQAGRLRGPANGPTILDADRAQWDYNPKMRNRTYTTSPESKAGWGRFYQWSSYPASEVSRDFNGCVQLMKRYVAFRASNSAANAEPLDRLASDASTPSRPVIQYTGPAGYPADDLRFRSSAYQGSAPFAAMRWRVGEVTAPGASWASAEPWKYEIEPAWESDRLTTFTSDITVPSGVLRVGGTYRARALVEDNEGRTSHWSEPIQFVVKEASTVATISEDLRLTELMYNSADGAANDFLELHNAGSSPLDLTGAAFTTGITYTFPANATIAPGGYILVVRADPAGNYAAFRALHGLSSDVPIFGPYGGNLSDNGEELELTGPGGGAVLLRVNYSDGRGWPVAADGVGHSIVPKNVSLRGGDLDYAGNWRASTTLRGSPGVADPEPIATLVINEVVSHTDFQSEFDSNDWIELYQRADTPFVFGPGWYLSDNPENLKRWQIPAGREVAGRGFIVFDEVTGFNNPPGSGFGLSKAGEEVFLSYFPANGPGGVVDAVSFKGQQNDWSLGRVPDGENYWDQFSPRTRGTPNGSSPPRVVISEILFHEGGLPTDALPAEFLEFVELQNTTAQTVTLFNDIATFRFTGGIDFQFPAGLRLAPGERLVIVSFDPVASPATLAGFRTTFNIGSNVQIVGPYTGRFDNDTDRVALEGAQPPDVPTDLPSWVILDEVLYFDRAPWPAGADGQGRSLNRTHPQSPGSDPASWQVASPSPGGAPDSGGGDSDGDGMPDTWELANGLNPQDPSDAAGDADEDGATNKDEYLAGTDPGNAQSLLGITSVQRASEEEVSFSFPGIANHAYVVETSADLGLAGWSNLESVPAVATNRVVTIRVPISREVNRGFLRVRLE